MIESLVEKSNIGKISTNKTVHNLPLSKRERAHFFLNDFFTNKKPKKPLKIIEQCPTRYTLDLNWESVKVKTRIITGPYEARGRGAPGAVPARQCVNCSFGIDVFARGVMPIEKM